MSRFYGTKIMAYFPFLRTWTLWRHLHYADTHPIYWRTLLKFPAERTIRYAIGIVYLFMMLFVCTGWQSLSDPSLSNSFLLIILFLLGSSLYVMIWMIAICTAINKAQIQGTYDQFSLAPSGALGTSWAICTAVLHYNNALYWINLGRRIISLTIAGILLLLLFASIPQRGQENSPQFLSLFLQIMILTAASYVEHVQSVVIGGLTGMVVPTFTRTRPDIYFAAVAFFVIAQLASYVLTIFTAVLLLSASPLTLLAICFAVFCSVREGIIIALWHTLVYRLNAHASPHLELDHGRIPAIKGRNFRF